MDQFDIKFEQVTKQLGDLKTWVYNQSKEQSLSLDQFRKIMDRLEVIRQEAVSAADALS